MLDRPLSPERIKKSIDQIDVSKPVREQVQHLSREAERVFVTEFVTGKCDDIRVMDDYCSVGGQLGTQLLHIGEAAEKSGNLDLATAAKGLGKWVEKASNSFLVNYREADYEGKDRTRDTVLGEIRKFVEKYGN